MGNKIKKVSIQVSANFFDKIFEKERRNMQKQLGMNNLSQIKFTEMLASSNATIKLPKKIDLSFTFPIKRKRGKKSAWYI